MWCKEVDDDEDDAGWLQGSGEETETAHSIAEGMKEKNVGKQQLLVK